MILSHGIYYKLKFQQCINFIITFLSSLQYYQISKNFAFTYQNGVYQTWHFAIGLYLNFFFCRWYFLTSFGCDNSKNYLQFKWDVYFEILWFIGVLFYSIQKKPTEPTSRKRFEAFYFWHRIALITSARCVYVCILLTQKVVIEIFW